jgi:hypothetical protein
MKKLILGSLVLVIVVLGYLFLQTRANRTANKPTTFSSDGYTWRAGAVILDGTNVPASQWHIRALRSTNAPPQTNEPSK